MILHVACLPFPSRQGTQAAIAAMLRASAATGQPTNVVDLVALVRFPDDARRRRGIARDYFRTLNQSEQAHG